MVVLKQQIKETIAMYEFLNSAIFQTLVTLLVGTVAFIIYRKQKADYKRKAAKTILLEIQEAEHAIDKVRDAVKSGHLDVDVSLLQSESWSEYKQLFVKDFDSDEWKAVSDFYNKSALIDEAIKYNKTSFASDVEQIRTNKQRVLADFAQESVNKVDETYDNEKNKSLLYIFDLKVKAFDQMYMGKQNEFLYTPTKPVNDVSVYLDGFELLTRNSVGQKLKKLASRRDFLGIMPLDKNL